MPRNIPHPDWLTGRVLARAGILLLLTAVLSFAAARKDGPSVSETDPFLSRPDYGGEAYDKTLEASWMGETHAVTVHVEPRQYTEQETAQLLSGARAFLNTSFSGTDLSHVDRDLSFPKTVPDSPVCISWFTDNGRILDPDGTIGEDVPSGGTPVLAEALLSLGDLTETLSYRFVVYPKLLTEEDAFRHSVREALNRTEDPSSPLLALPAELDGEPVSWRAMGGRNGFPVLLAGTAAAVLSIFAAYSRQRQCQKEHEAALLSDYPLIAEKLVLLLDAGMSSRMAVKRIAKDYTERVRSGRPRREGFEELCLVCREMNRGISESDAYRNLGRRCPAAPYKTLSMLLVQNLARGSRTLLAVLEKEAEDAGSERRKRARILGEEASAKLLFPMLLMLGVVLVIMIVPAFMTMF